MGRMGSADEVCGFHSGLFGEQETYGKISVERACEKYWNIFCG